MPSNINVPKPITTTLVIGQGPAGSSPGGAGNAFTTIVVSGQSNIVADSSADTLTLVAGTGITLTTNAGTDTITIEATGGAGVSDGDKGDIVVSSSGTVYTIDTGAVTLAKMADMATSSLIYRKTAGTGAPEVNTLATLKTDLGLSGTNSGDQDLSSYATTAAVAAGYQPLDSDLTAIAALTTTSYGRAFLALADAAAARTALSLGSLATQSGTFSGTSSGTNSGDDAVNSLYSGLVTNATHTGEVTGSGSLTVDKTAITGKTLVSASVGDHVLVADASDSDNLKRVTVQTIVDLASGTGSVATDTIWGAAGDLVVGNGSNSAVRLAMGAADQVLTVNSGGTAIEWADPVAGGTPTAITVAAETSDTSCSILFVTAASGDLGPKTNTGLTFNSSTGVLTATGFSGPLTGNVTGNASGTAATFTGSLTGDVTSSAMATTIANDAVTYAKMQNVSAASKLLGRGDSGSGDVQEITLGSGLTMTGTTLAASGGSASDLLSTLVSAEISVTTTATATISRMHVCSGTTSDYTVTLPAASGNTGKLIGIRISTACTKLITIDGDGSEQIDGAANRVMWAGESCILLCDGSNWFKIAGKSIPMYCRIKIASNVTVTADTNVLITCDTSVSDNTGLMANTGSTRIDIKRESPYKVVSSVKLFDTGSGFSACYAFKNSGTNVVAAGGGTYVSGGIYLGTAFVPLVAGDYLRLYAYQFGGSTALASGDLCFIEAMEIVQW